MKQVMTICVFGTSFQFEPNDVIFELEMKNETPCYTIVGLQTQCFACKVKLKKSVQCEFCAMTYCLDCRTRVRAFPNSIILENGEQIHGKICKICDRKFLFKSNEYRKEIKPMINRDEDLRHLVESYGMKLNKANYAITEEARLSEELMQKQNFYNLQKRKLQTTISLHTDSIRRGEALLLDTDRNIKVQMVEM